MVANLRGPEPQTSTFGSRYKAKWLIHYTMCDSDLLSVVANCESVQKIELQIQTRLQSLDHVIIQ
jgi:hypothetical protein